MVAVALAGAAHGMGSHILEAVLRVGKHSVTVLSRNSNPELSSRGIDVRIVDYQSHQSLVEALRGVHTVVSSIASFPEDVVVNSQLALIAAAKEVGVKRFAPSEFSLPNYEGIEFYAGKYKVLDALKTSGMAYTRFTCGLFMNLLAVGTPRASEEEALKGLRPWNFIIDIAMGTADIPGDGNTPTTFTEISDIGTFVAAALDLDQWEEESGMVGETLTWNEVVKKAEEVTGRNFLVRYTSDKDLQTMAHQPGKKFYNQVRIAIAEGKCVVEPKLNAYLPGFRPNAVQGMLERYWSGVSFPEPTWTEGVTFGV